MASSIDIARLTQQERLDLIEELWESLSEDEREALPLTDAQRDELDHRLDELDRDGSVGATPDELRQQVKRHPA